MGFQELKSSYMKETVPLKKIQLIESVALHFKNGWLEFLLSQYKGETDGRVRKKMIDVAGKNINEISIQLLIKALTDNNVESKKASVIALGKAKASKALIPLLSMLQNPSLEIKDVVLASIIRIGKEGALDIIFNYINKGNIHVKRSIPYILGKIGSRECIEQLKELLTHEDPLIRKNSIKGLDKLIQIKEAKFILNALSDQDLRVKKAAIRALATIRSKRAIPHLIKFLKEKNPEIRKLSVRTLFSILSNQPPPYDKIYEILNGRNLISRREAIKLLSLLEDKNSIDYLIRTFNSKDAKLRRLAYNAILNIYKFKAPTQITEGLNAKEWRIRRLCARVIGEIGDENVINALFTLLSDNDSKVREAAIESLSRFGSDRIIERAKELTTDLNWKTRRAGVKLIIKIGDGKSVESLIVLMEDEDIFIRSWVAMALGKLENISDITPFITLLKDKDPKMRIAAAKALSQIGDKEALEHLAKSLWDDDWKVKKEIEVALNTIDPNWLELI